MTIGKKKNPKIILCSYNAKISSRLIYRLMLIVTGLLTLLFNLPIFLFRDLVYLFVCNADLLLFSLLLIDGNFLVKIL